MAAGFGGLLGAAAVDVLRSMVSDPSAFGAVFLAEAALFLFAAVMALRIMDRAPARAPSSSLVPGE
jgi:BCD family chlorophyll transporter-like MFS transporter